MRRWFGEERGALVRAFTRIRRGRLAWRGGWLAEAPYWREPLVEGWGRGVCAAARSSHRAALRCVIHGQSGVFAQSAHGTFGAMGIPWMRANALMNFSRPGGSDTQAMQDGHARGAKIWLTSMSAGAVAPCWRPPCASHPLFVYRVPTSRAAGRIQYCRVILGPLTGCCILSGVRHPP